MSLEAVGSVDDGRLELLFTRINQLIPSSSAAERERIRDVMCHAVSHSTTVDFRVLSVTVRLLGLLPMRDDATASNVKDLLFHHEPLVRLAGLTCLVQWSEYRLELGVLQWKRLLSDDSMYVQKRARDLFALQWSRWKHPACVQVLRDAFEIPSVDLRAETLLMVSIVGSFKVGDDAISLVEQFVSRFFMSELQHRTVLAVVEAMWSKGWSERDARVASDWMDRLLADERIDDAVELCKSLSVCGMDNLVLHAAPVVLKRCGNSPLQIVKVCGTMGRNAFSVPACLSCLRFENRRAFLGALRLLAEWQVPISPDLARSLVGDSRLTSQILKAVLLLNANWCSDEGLSVELARLLGKDDPWMSSEIWDCVARCRGTSLADACVASILRLSVDDQMMAHAWEEFVHWLGPHHLEIDRLMQESLRGCCARSAALFTCLKWRAKWQQLPALLEKRVSELAKTCLVEDEDWSCVCHSLKWIVAVQDGEAKHWIVKGLTHWARPVRLAAKELLNPDWGIHVTMEEAAADASSDPAVDAFLLDSTLNKQPLECCD
jgi:hypothetical protein